MGYPRQREKSKKSEQEDLTKEQIKILNEYVKEGVL